LLSTIYKVNDVALFAARYMLIRFDKAGKEKGKSVLVAARSTKRIRLFFGLPLPSKLLIHGSRNYNCVCGSNTVKTDPLPGSDAA